jgi:hypothetical protein
MVQPIEDLFCHDASLTEKQRMGVIVEKVLLPLRKQGVPQQNYLMKTPDPIVSARIQNKPRADYLDFKLFGTSLCILDPVLMHGSVLPGANPQTGKAGMLPCAHCGSCLGVYCKDVRTDRVKVAMASDGPCYVVPVQYEHKGCPQGKTWPASIFYSVPLQLCCPILSHKQRQATLLHVLRPVLRALLPPAATLPVLLRRLPGVVPDPTLLGKETDCIAAAEGSKSTTFYSHDEGVRVQLCKLGLDFVYDAFPFHFTGDKAIYKPLLSQLLELPFPPPKKMLELYEDGHPVTVSPGGAGGVVGWPGLVLRGSPSLSSIIIT